MLCLCALDALCVLKIVLCTRYVYMLDLLCAVCLLSHAHFCADLMKKCPFSLSRQRVCSPQLTLAYIVTWFCVFTGCDNLIVMKYLHKVCLPTGCCVSCLCCRQWQTLWWNTYTLARCVPLLAGVCHVCVAGNGRHCDETPTHWGGVFPYWLLPLMSVLQAMADIVKNHLQTGEVCSPQLTLRCPMCVNATCGMAKEFFASQQSLLDELLHKSSSHCWMPSMRTKRYSDWCHDLTCGLNWEAEFAWVSLSPFF